MGNLRHLGDKSISTFYRLVHVLVLERSDTYYAISSVVPYTGCLVWSETWVGLTLVLHIPLSAWASGNWAELARHLCKLVDHLNQSQPNLGLRPDRTPYDYDYGKHLVSAAVKVARARA